MSALNRMVADYLELRRGMGFKLRQHEARLGCFVTFMARHHAARITTQLALEFATHDPSLSARTVSMRLSMVRAFARYVASVDPSTEVPPVGLVPDASRPATPYIYTDEEIARFLDAARNYPVWKKFPGPRWQRCRAWLWYCFFALLATTGMRLSEARHLRDEDFDPKESVLVVRGTKFGKSRLVPLHLTVVRALRKYLKHRDAFFAHVLPTVTPQRMFVTSLGTELGVSAVNRRFRRLSRLIGLRGPNDRHGPRIHDLRHRFAVETLLRWYRNDENVDHLLPVLSTYLGHTRVTGTYWYLRCTPELMAAARGRLEGRWKGSR